MAEQLKIPAWPKLSGLLTGTVKDEYEQLGKEYRTIANRFYATRNATNQQLVQDAYAKGVKFLTEHGIDATKSYQDNTKALGQVANAASKSRRLMELGREIQSIAKAQQEDLAVLEQALSPTPATVATDSEAALSSAHIPEVASVLVGPQDQQPAAEPAKDSTSALADAHGDTNAQGDANAEGPAIANMTPLVQQAIAEN